MTTTVPNPVKVLKTKFTQSLGLPFRELLPESEIQQAIDELNIKYRRRLFDPFITLWVFLSQVLDVDKSCENAVSRVIAWLANETTEIPSIDTSAYCKARKRLSEKLLEKLFSAVAKKIQDKVMPSQLWCGRRIKVRNVESWNKSSYNF